MYQRREQGERHEIGIDTHVVDIHHNNLPHNLYFVNVADLSFFCNKVPLQDKSLANWLSHILEWLIFMMHHKNSTPQTSVSVSLNFAIVYQVHHIFIALIFDQIDAGPCLKLKTKFNNVIVVKSVFHFLFYSYFICSSAFQCNFL